MLLLAISNLAQLQLLIFSLISLFYIALPRTRIRGHRLFGALLSRCAEALIYKGFLHSCRALFD